MDNQQQRDSAEEEANRQLIRQGDDEYTGAVFRLEIKTGGSAFVDDLEAELSRMVREVGNLVRVGHLCGYVRDINGNGSGQWHHHAS